MPQGGLNAVGLPGTCRLLGSAESTERHIFPEWLRGRRRGLSATPSPAQCHRGGHSVSALSAVPAPAARRQFGGPHLREWDMAFTLPGRLFFFFFGHESDC